MPVPNKSEANYLLSIESVRERTLPIFQLALQNNLDYFDVDLSKLDQAIEFITGIIKRDFGTEYSKIPPHGRWGHLNAGDHQRVESLISNWRFNGVDEIEIGRKLIDLFVFSVLIDAGAGNDWKYLEKSTGEFYTRSEGLAIASIDLFKSGELSNDKDDLFQVNARKLIEFNAAKLKESFQINFENPLSGEDGRLKLIQDLGRALNANEKLFGKDGRPGNLIEYLFEVSNDGELDLTILWDSLMEAYTPIWPKGRTQLDGISLGDAWPLSTTLKVYGPDEPFEKSIIPFHKLTQWLSYSLLTPLKEYGYKFKIARESLQTGLPEYRNGGLFYDFGVIQLKQEFLEKGLRLSKKIDSKTPEIPSFTPEDGVIVEWRAITIGFLDHILPLINEKLGFNLTLPQLIEAGSWKSGREIAGKLRPLTKGPPIDLYSDGTVF